MHRKRHHKIPIIEKQTKNPLSDLKPGVYLPIFRLYGLDKSTDETTITSYNESTYVEKKNKKEHRLGCQVRLSECTPKTVNFQHQGDRRLQRTLQDISKRRHTTLKENDIYRQRLVNELNMKVKRTTVPLDHLIIPSWTYREDVCKCYQCEGKACPVHCSALNKLQSIPEQPSILRQRLTSYITDTGQKEVAATETYNRRKSLGVLKSQVKVGFNASDQRKILKRNNVSKHTSHDNVQDGGHVTLVGKSVNINDRPAVLRPKTAHSKSGVSSFRLSKVKNRPQTAAP